VDVDLSGSQQNAGREGSSSPESFGMGSSDDEEDLARAITLFSRVQGQGTQQFLPQLEELSEQLLLQ
jgi:hypothetical protein